MSRLLPSVSGFDSSPPVYPQPLEYSYALPDGTLNAWIQDDFCFLQLEDLRKHPVEFTALSFVYPIINPPAIQTRIFVTGFPGYISEADLTGQYPTLQVPYRDLLVTFGGFVNKVVSFGTVTQPPQPAHHANLVHHTASTIPGMSGGLVHYLGGAPFKGFNGIHVGGAHSLNQNFSIPVTNVNLALYYFKSISIDTQDFLSMDRDSLRPYYDHFANQLPPQIIAQFADFF